MTATRQLKQQVTELLMNDKSIIESMAEVVSSLIIEKLSNSEEIFVKIATKIMNNSEFVKSVTSNFEGHTGAIKQELYESLSFDDHEIKDRLMKIEEYSGELNDKIKSMEWEIDSLEQYSRRNCLLIHGIPEPSQPIVEDTDALVINVLSEKLGVQVGKAHLDRSHRLGRRNPLSGTRPKPRPVIAKFVSYNTRSDVFRQKRKLKGTGMGITESLTKQRMDLYKAVCEHPNISSAWSIDGRIIGLRRDNKNKVVIESPVDLRKL